MDCTFTFTSTVIFLDGKGVKENQKYSPIKEKASWSLRSQSP